MSGYIETYTGKAFFPLAPATEDIDIRDIVRALSHQCRFSGHARQFYSVAEHSVRVALLLGRAGHDRKTRMWGLLHDASEAYLVDVPSPLKVLPEFEVYREAEKRLMVCICERFGLDYVEPACVRIADLVLLATEARDLMPFRPEHWANLPYPPMRETIVPWSAEVACENFLECFEGLGGVL